MSSMGLQFSLATLLICMTVLAVACRRHPKVGRWINLLSARSWIKHRREPPNVREVFWRMAYWEPQILVATLAGLWIVRRLKSRREIEPPVG